MTVGVLIPVTRSGASSPAGGRTRGRTERCGRQHSLRYGLNRHDSVSGIAIVPPVTWHLAMNEMVRFIAFVATIFPTILALLALMTWLESDLDDSDADNKSDR